MGSSEAFPELDDDERRAQVTAADESIGIRHLRQCLAEMTAMIVDVRHDGDVHAAPSKSQLFPILGPLSLGRRAV